MERSIGDPALGHRAVGEPVGSYAYDVLADVWTWGAAVYEIHGMPPLGTVPSTEMILERVHPSDRQSTWEHFQRHLREPGPYSCSYRILDPGGHIHTVVYVGEAFATDGRVTRLEGYAVDITTPMAQTAATAVEASAAHRAAIEQVKGALMLTYGVDEHVAFTLLRGYSNNKNVRLATLARRIADRLDSPEYRELGAPQTLLAILEDVSHPDAVAGASLADALSATPAGART